MTSLTIPEQVGALRDMLFGAIDTWNLEHPQRLRARHERACVHVAHVFADASGKPTYAVTVECTLAGSAALTFHGTDLPTVAEHARLTLEHKIDVELRRRADRDQDDEEHHYAHPHGIAV